MRFVAFVDEVERVVVDAGGRTCFVHVTAPESVLVTRVAADSRALHGKLTDATMLRELLAEHDGASVHEDDLRVDSSITNVDEAVTCILDSVQSTQKPL